MTQPFTIEHIQTPRGPAVLFDPWAASRLSSEERLQRDLDRIEAEALPDAKVEFDLTDAIEQGSRSLIMFGHLFLPGTFRQPSPEFHYDIAELLDGVDRYVALKVFRGAAKTSLLRTYALRRICFGLSRTIFLVSAKQEHAVISLRWIKKQVERNTRIGQAFGLRRGDKWTDEWIELACPGPDGVRVNVLAAGLTGQIRGFNLDDFRPDLILLDDGQTEESVGTPEQRKKTNALVFGALANSLAPATENPLAKLVMLQTPMERDDAVDIACRDPLWAHKEFPILREGQSLWDVRYPLGSVLAEKAAFIARGQYDLWMRELEVTIARSQFKAFDIEKLQFWTTLPTTRNDCICAIDPASADGKKADQNVVLTALRQGPDIYVCAYHANRGQMPDETANQFFEHKIRFRPTKLRVESIGFQRVLAWYIRNQMREKRIFVPIDEVQDKRHKQDRIIQALAGLVSHGFLHLHASMTELVDEMRSYEPSDKEQKDDILDALAMAVDGLNNPFVLGDELEGTLADTLEEEERLYGRVAGFRRAP